MACIPNVPIATDIRDSGWLVFPSPDLTTLVQWEPVDAVVLTAANMVESTRQAFEIIQIQIRETASSAANIKKNNIQLMLFTDAAPPTPVEGVVYNTTPTNSLGLPGVVVADYVRHSDTVWLATKATSIVATSGVLGTATNIYIVAVFSAATPLQYIPGAGLEVRIYTRMAQLTN